MRFRAGVQKTVKFSHNYNLEDFFCHRRSAPGRLRRVGKNKRLQRREYLEAENLRPRKNCERPRKKEVKGLSFSAEKTDVEADWIDLSCRAE